MNHTSRTVPREGQILYVHHLHLDSIVLDRDSEPVHDESRNYIHTLYTVTGKPRPMLVIGLNGEQRNEIQWYWVIKLTRQKRRGYVRLGDLLRDGTGTVSYTEYGKTYSYPENLFEEEVKADLGPFGLQPVLRIAGISPGSPLR